MAITTEEREYFLEGIRRVFPKTSNANLAKIFVKDGSDTASLIKKLNDITDYVPDFVAEASAKGVVTPESIMDISEADIANMQKYIGFDHNDVRESKEYINIKKAIDEINKFIGNGGLDSFKDPIITSCLNELDKRISEISNKVDNDISPSGSGSYVIYGEPKTLTRCIYNREIK
jgi:ABC-type proline/glycine betaine transport system ATPase subunit